MWAGAWWVGIYVLLRFGFTAPIPASVVTIYMGIISLAILAYVSSSQERREEVSRPLVRLMTEKRYTALLAATVVAIPALAAANVYVQMNVPLEPPLFSRTVHPASPSEITVHDKKIDLDAGENPFRHLETSNPDRVPQTRRERAPGLLSELRLLPRRQPVPATACSCTGWTRSRPTSPTGDDPDASRDVSVLADLQGRPRASRGRRSLGHGHARLGEVPEGRGDVGCDPLSLRFHRPQASRQEEAAHEMTSCLIGPRASLAAGCVAVLIASLCAAPTGSVRAQRLPTSGPRRSGSRARSSTSNTARSATARRGTAKATPPRICARRPRNFTTGQVQGSHDSQRSAPDASGPRQHHQARHAVHVDARLAQLSPIRKCRISPTSSRPSPPTSRTPRRSPSPCRSRARRARTKESIELGKKLYEETGCVKCHGTLGRGDGPSAPTLMDDWGHPIRAADLAQSWTFRGGSTREDIFRTMSTGLNGTPMPSFVDALSPSSDGRSRTSSSLSRGATGPAIPTSSSPSTSRIRSIWRRGPRASHPRPSARFPIVGQIMEPGRAFHPPATSVDRSGHLRRRVDRPPRSMARHERGEDGEERAGASRAAGGGGGSRAGEPWPRPRREEPWPAAAAAGSAVRRSRAERQRRQPASRPSSPTPSRSRFLRRCRRAPASPTSSSATPRTRWISGSSIWRAPDPLQFTGKGSADIAPNDTGDVTGVASYDQGEWSVIFKRPLRPTSGAPFTPGEFMPVAFSVWDGFSRERGNRRGLTVWHSLYVEPEVVPSAVGPMVRTALLILAIELAVIWLGAAALRLSRPRGARR